MKSEREKKKPKHPLSKSTTSFLYDPSNHIFSVVLPEDPGIIFMKGFDLQTSIIYLRHLVLIIIAIIYSVWKKTLKKTFPGSVREEEFVTEVRDSFYSQKKAQMLLVLFLFLLTQTEKVLNERGFFPHNALSCVSVCRDELCSPVSPYHLLLFLRS